MKKISYVDGIYLVYKPLLDFVSKKIIIENKKIVWNDKGSSYNEREIKNYIITATSNGIELVIDNSVPEDILEFIESQKNKWNRVKVLEQKV